MESPKEKKKFWISIVSEVALATALVTVGLFVVSFSVYRGNNLTNSAFNDELKSISTLTNKAANVLIRDSRSSIEFLDPEKDADSFIADINLSDNDVFAVVSNDGQTRLTIKGGKSVSDVKISLGIVKGGCSFATVDDVPYFAVVGEEKNGLRCLLLLSATTIANELLPESAERDYAVYMYSRKINLAFYASNKSAYIRFIPDDYSFENADSFSALIKHDRESGVTIDNVIHDDEGTGFEKKYVIAVSPSSDSSMFTVGIAVDTDEFLGVKGENTSVLVIGIVTTAFGLGLVIYSCAKIGKRSRKIEKDREIEEEAKKKMNHRQRLESIGMMTASIAHEFNNMLTPVMGYSVMLMDKVDSENDEIMNGLSEIYESASRAKKLISRISQLSRTNSDEPFTMISPNHLVLRVLDLMRPVCPKNILIEFDLEVEEKCISGSMTQLSQLLTNLIINAFQAMKDGGKLLITTSSPNKDHVRISVNDTGTGITDEVKERMFDPFFTTKPVNEGTGLGLAIVHQIADNHGAVIEVDSKVGKGSTFTVDFTRVAFVPEED